MINKLCLGTAKLGIPSYGYSSSRILVNSSEFLLRALRLGICNLDTSPRYGDCERIVGNVLKKLDIKPIISSKIDNLIPGSNKNPDLMLKSIELSINRLNTDIIDICYLHQNEIEIISDKYVHEGISFLKKKSLIKEIGTSIYSELELKYTLESGIFDWVQIPVNILDTSFYKMICESNNNIKVSARSIFLQGILLNRSFISSDIKKHSELLKTLNQIDKLCVKFGISLQQLLIAYLTQLENINQIIIGTSSINNLKDNILSLNIKLHPDLVSSIDIISKIPKSWTNPRNWTRG